MALRLAASGSQVARYEPPPLAYDRACMALLGRASFHFTTEGLSAEAALVAPAEDEAVPLALLRWTLGDCAVELVLPARIIATLLHAVEPAPRGVIDAAAAVLLLELALAGPLDALEAAAGQPIRLIELDDAAPAVDIQPISAIRVMPDPIVIGLAGAFDDEPFTARLRVPGPGMEALRRLTVSLPVLRVPVRPSVALAVRLGLARIGTDQLRSLEIGDAVVLQRPADGRVMVVLGEHLAALGRLAGSRVTLEAGPRPVTAAMRRWTMAGDQREDIEPQNATLEELQVTLVFELARQAVTLREVQALAAGHVIELGPLAEQQVSVLANGSRIGRGELVRVGEVMAVRLTRLDAA